MRCHSWLVVMGPASLQCARRAVVPWCLPGQSTGRRARVIPAGWVKVVTSCLAGFRRESFGRGAGWTDRLRPRVVRGPGLTSEQCDVCHPMGVIGFDVDRHSRRSGSRMQGYLVNAPCKTTGADSKRTDRKSVV